jgi:hypothetical protein
VFHAIRCLRSFLEKHLAEKRFSVPTGLLSVGKGKREAHVLGTALSMLRDVRDKILSSHNLCKELDIGCVGTGNDGKASFIVLLENGFPRHAWSLVIQTKQEVSAVPSNDTCRGIIKSFDT